MNIKKLMLITLVISMVFLVGCSTENTKNISLEICQDIIKKSEDMYYKMGCMEFCLTITDEIGYCKNTCIEMNLKKDEGRV